MATAPATIPRLLIERVTDQAGAVAVVGDDGALTYCELLIQATVVAEGLAARGLAAGDRLAMKLANGCDWLVAYWGAALAGLVVVPIGIRNRPAEINAMLARCGAAALLVAADAESSERYAVAKVFDLDSVREEGERAPAGELARRLSGLGPGDVHLLQFTSGSTGQPKAATLTHGGMIANAAALASAWGLGPGDALVVPGPFSHILGLMSGCLVPMVAGAACLTMAAFRPERALELIDVHHAVGMAGTPTHYLMLIEHPDRQRYDCSSLRFAMHGGGPMTPDAAGRIRADLGVSALLSGFGMSETSGGVTSVAIDDPPEIQITTVGRPLPTFEVKVVDPQTAAQMPRGTAGELWVRGSPVMRGYWHDADDTDRALTADGWLRTGDLAEWRDDGRLRIVGRLKETLIVGGYNVQPSEIERVLSTHPSVAEAAVVAGPDHRLGEVPVAFIRLQPEATVTGAELEALCKDQLAGYKVPHHYAFLDTFPVSGSGKVERFKLREHAAIVVESL